MKIALAAPTRLPARRANTMQVMKMAQALAALGHEVRLASPGPPERRGNSRVGWDELARLYGLEREFPVEWLSARSGLRGYDYALRAVGWARHWGADLLYTRLPQAAALGSGLGQATVFEVHDLPQGKTGPFLFRRFLGGRGARRLVTITRALAADLEARFGPLPPPPFTLVAPDGVDLARYASLPEPAEARRRLADRGWEGLAEGCPPIERFTAGYTGHLYPGRGRELLLELAARLPEISFLLAGGEPQDVVQLREAARQRGMTNVYLAGFVPNAELPGFQAACEALLMPYSRRVAASSGGDIGRYLSPMKLFEYLAAGRVVVSSDLPVLRESLTPENAILLPPDDPEAWMQALQTLAAEPARRARLAAAARRTAEGCTWEARAEKILEGL